MMRKSEKMIVLVTSCKAYQDVLRHFEFFFQKYWKDCPFPVVLNVDEKIETEFPYDDVVISPHRENLIRMRDVPFGNVPYVLMMQDDHWLFQNVDTERICRYLNLAEQYHAGNFRLIPDPGSDDVVDAENGIVEYKPGKAYRISARGGIWRTDYFLQYVNQFDDLWQMEQGGQDLSLKLPDRVLGTRFRELPFFDAVKKGKYIESARYLLEANHQTAERPYLDGKAALKEDLKAAIIEVNPDLVTKAVSTFHMGYKPKYGK